MDKFEVKPKPDLSRCMLSVRLSPASAEKLEHHAKVNRLHRSELAGQMLEYELAKLPAVTGGASAAKAEKRAEKKAKEVENGAVQGGTVSIATQR